MPWTQHDLCGVCNGDNACLGCDGKPFSNATYDSCGICNGHGTSCVTTGALSSSSTVGTTGLAKVLAHSNVASTALIAGVCAGGGFLLLLSVLVSTIEISMLTSTIVVLKKRHTTQHVKESVTLESTEMKQTPPAVSTQYNNMVSETKYPFWVHGTNYLLHVGSYAPMQQSQSSVIPASSHASHSPASKSL